MQNYEPDLKMLFCHGGPNHGESHWVDVNKSYFDLLPPWKPEDMDPLRGGRICDVEFDKTTYRVVERRTRTEQYYHLEPA